jgi:CubicO group peptidase (beta-lactamase class C family)
MMKASTTTFLAIGVLLATASLMRPANDIATASAQDKTAEIDKVFSWATPATPGCAVAASKNGELVVNRAYGLADVDRKVPITPLTAFDVGSVVKQFVAAAVLLLVEEKRLSLTDDIRKYIPELPDYGHGITLDHLLTHTSGIRDWVGLRSSGRGETALTVILRQRELDFPPGEQWSYSNSGYVLLKEVVARTTGTSFGEFARTRLFERLGMKSTAYLPDDRKVENLALAYEKAGTGWRVDMLFGNARGGDGALYSTAPDLVIWNDALTGGRLGAFVTTKIQEPASLGNGKKLNYARGLYVDSTTRGQLVWHAGSAAAYKTAVGRLPEHRLSIAVACNAGQAADARTKFAAQVLDLFVPGGR